MPFLLAMRGAPGTGKSTVARALSRRLQWPLIDKDDVKDVLDVQMDAAGGPSYDVMIRVVRRQLLQGLSVIADSPLPRQAYDGLVRVAGESDSLLLVLECRCSDEVAWRARIKHRRSLDLPAHHTTTWEAVEEFRRRHTTTEYSVRGPNLVLDTTRPLVAITDDVMRWLAHIEDEQAPPSSALRP